MDWCCDYFGYWFGFVGVVVVFGNVFVCFCVDYWCFVGVGGEFGFVVWIVGGVLGCYDLGGGLCCWFGCVLVYVIGVDVGVGGVLVVDDGFYGVVVGLYGFCCGLY